MVTRILPEAEWPRLAATGCQLEQGYRDAVKSGYVLVTENEVGEIVGTMFVTMSLRFDGAWTDPRYRDGSVLRRLGHAAMRMAEDLGVSKVFAPVKNLTLAEWLIKRGASVQPELLFSVVKHG
jgi:hypothetical protein